MPIKKTSKRYARKRSRRRALRRYKAYGPQRAILSGFPDRQLVKLRYSQEVTLDPGPGGISQHIFRANSLYDPDFTGIGHQPYLYDQWSEVYSHYCVLGSRMTATLVTVNTLNQDPGYYGILLSDDTNGTTNFTSIDNVFESKLSSNPWRMSGSANTIQASNYKSSALSRNFSAKKFFGVKNVNDGDAYTALTGANPAKIAYFCLWNASIATNDPAPSVYRIVIDYIALMSKANVLPGS